MTKDPEPASQRDVWQAARNQVGDSVLSIVMPAHNLAPSLVNNIRKVHAIFEGNLPIEIVVVDDGSTDDTKAAIQQAAD